MLFFFNLNKFPSFLVLRNILRDPWKRIVTNARNINTVNLILQATYPLNLDGLYSVHKIISFGVPIAAKLGLKT